MFWIFSLLLNWTCSDEKCKLKWVFACLTINCENWSDKVSAMFQLDNLSEAPDRRWKQIKVSINKPGNWGKPYLEWQEDYLCHHLSQCNQPCQSDLFERKKMYCCTGQFISLSLNTVCKWRGEPGSPPVPSCPHREQISLKLNRMCKVWTLPKSILFSLIDCLYAIFLIRKSTPTRSKN